MKSLNIIVVKPGSFTGPTQFFIDCPIDTWMDDLGGVATELKRIEIPRELALYIDTLQNEIKRLKNERKD